MEWTLCLTLIFSPLLYRLSYPGSDVAFLMACNLLFLLVSVKQKMKYFGLIVLKKREIKAGLNFSLK